MAKRRGRSAAFMRSINPNLKKRRRKINKGGSVRYSMKRRSYSRKGKRRSSRSSGVMGIILGAIGGAVGYMALDAVIHPILATYVPAVAILVAEAGLGIYLATSKRGMIKTLGIVLAAIPTFFLAQQFIGPALSSILPGISA